MQSVEIPAVTQARASGDYEAGTNTLKFCFQMNFLCLFVCIGGDQWKIGISSLFCHALDIAPSKDNYWSTLVQKGCPRGTKEPYNRLQAAVLTLSTGPVAPGDAVGASNPDLIMRSCNAEGRLLMPDRPATAINAQFKFVL